MTVHGEVLWRTWHWKAEGHPLHPSEALKRFKTGRDREGEAPAEPHGPGLARAMARQEARPLVPVTAPISSSTESAKLFALKFIQDSFPLLDQFIPK